MPAYVLDTSAILTVLNGEPGRETVLDILDQARKGSGTGLTLVYLPFVALMETEYWTLRRLPPLAVESMMALVLNWPAKVVESDPAWRHRAASIKATQRLSVADAWITSLALSLEATLVHKDPEFDGVQGLQALRLS